MRALEARTRSTVGLEPYERSFYNAVGAIHGPSLGDIRRQVNETMRRLPTSLKGLSGEDLNEFKAQVDQLVTAEPKQVALYTASALVAGAMALVVDNRPAKATFAALALASLGNALWHKDSEGRFKWMKEVIKGKDVVNSTTLWKEIYPKYANNGPDYDLMLQ